MLRVQNLSFKYFAQAKRLILKNINFKLPAGKASLLAGNSGCGKSTFLLILAGLLPENNGYLASGKVWLDSRDISEYSPAKRASKIALVMQNPDLQFCMQDLRSELVFCLENLGQDPSLHQERIGEITQLLEIEDLLDRELASLSGGEKQRASLACALINRAEIVLLDEPFANLDQESIKYLLKILRKLKESTKLSFLIIDHRLDLWQDFIDEIYLMNDSGEILASKIKASKIQDSLDLFEQNQIALPLALAKLERAKKRTVNKTVVLELADYSLFIGQEKTKFCRQIIPGTGRRLIKSSSLKVYENEMVAILGKSGIGKSSLFWSLMKQLPYEGSALIKGQEIAQLREEDCFLQASLAVQNPAQQFLALKVLDELVYGLQITKNYKEAESREIALSYLADFKLARYANFSPYMLSQGQQRRLAVLSLIMSGQKLLLLDEPSYGQDSANIKQMMDLLRRLCEEEGLTVVFSTHDQDIARIWADRIFKIEDAKIKEEQ